MLCGVRRCCGRRGDSDRAIADFTAAIAIDPLPRSDEAYSRRGNAVVAKHDVNVYENRALALLELKSALEEALSDKLGLARGASQAALLAEIDRQNVLDKQSSDELKRLFLQMTQAESQVLASQSFKVSPELVEQTRQRVLGVLSAIDAASWSPR